MKLLTNLEMNKNQIVDAVLQSLAIEPSEAIAGQIYYNTKNKRAYVYTGSAWIAMDAKDASPTAISIVNTINNGDSLIDIDKIKDISTKLSASNIVDTINKGSENINAEKINGLANALGAEAIVEKINSGNNKINTSKIDGLDEKLKIETIIQALIASDEAIPTTKITGLDNALASKVTDSQAQQKANTALQEAKEYAKAEISKVIGGASEAYDTLKEIEEILKKSDSANKLINQAMKGKTSKFSQDIGNGRDTQILIRHNLKTQDVLVTLREKESPFKVVYADVEITDENTITLKFAKAPKINEYRAIIVG
ncbi:hypothetical protein SAMN05216454_1199 [Peptostreptococcus russellii]|uniref:Uncharacterized protein n=1 Tax=Peptostreptococcus russellii TaxID=215200 RepID=A0A1H8JXY6_9FIRM|nr:hypothetical protein [Peptostreptococcus russellii]SEN85614.1 hypothetical protein SAMN05216454_1199 [Peptostreptococcus russellii]